MQHTSSLALQASIKHSKTIPSNHPNSRTPEVSASKVFNAPCLFSFSSCCCVPLLRPLLSSETKLWKRAEITPNSCLHNKGPASRQDSAHNSLYIFLLCCRKSVHKLHGRSCASIRPRVVQRGRETTVCTQENKFYSATVNTKPKSGAQVHKNIQEARVRWRVPKCKQYSVNRSPPAITPHCINNSLIRST